VGWLAGGGSERSGELTGGGGNGSLRLGWRAEGEWWRLNRGLARPVGDDSVMPSRSTAHAGGRTRTDRRSEGGASGQHGARGAPVRGVARTPARHGAWVASEGAWPRIAAGLERRDVGWRAGVPSRRMARAAHFHFAGP
jgi:hypothetical protein